MVTVTAPALSVSLLGLNGTSGLDPAVPIPAFTLPAASVAAAMIPCVTFGLGGSDEYSVPSCIM